MSLRRWLRFPFGRGNSGPRRPPVEVRALAELLSEAGHTAEPAPAEAPEQALAGTLKTRSRGLLVIGGGPPDLVLVSGASERGHLADTEVAGFHWLVRREGLLESWPEGAVEAKRDFRASEVGSARRFYWTALDDSVGSLAASRVLNDLGSANDQVLRLLQDPGTLVIEVAPHPDLGLLRLSQYLGNRAMLERSDVAAAISVCRALVGSVDGPLGTG